MHEADRIDWSRAAVDSAHMRALGGGNETGPSPVDRGRPGSKHHAVVVRRGVPLAAAKTAANTTDAKALPRVVDAVPPAQWWPATASPACSPAPPGSAAC